MYMQLLPLLNITDSHYIRSQGSLFSPKYLSRDRPTTHLIQQKKQQTTKTWTRCETTLNQDIFWVATQTFFIFPPKKLGEMIQFDEHIFRMGWFNHQLEQRLVVLFHLLLIAVFLYFFKLPFQKRVDMHPPTKKLCYNLENEHETQKWRFGRWFSFSLGCFLGPSH